MWFECSGGGFFLTSISGRVVWADVALRHIWSVGSLCKRKGESERRSGRQRRNELKASHGDLETSYKVLVWPSGSSEKQTSWTRKFWSCQGSKCRPMRRKRGLHKAVLETPAFHPCYRRDTVAEKLNSLPHSCRKCRKLLKHMKTTYWKAQHKMEKLRRRRNTEATVK